MSEDIFPDYHEHDDFQPTMLALSHFAIQWNWAEHNFNVLLWQYAGDMISGAMFSASLSNQARADSLLSLVKRDEKDRKIRELVEFCVKAFTTINANRNALLHAHSISMDSTNEDKRPRWARASRNPRSLHVYCYADINDVTDNLNASCMLSILLGELIIFKRTQN